MSSTAPRHTALDALHRSLGATMTDFAGWDMPLRYGSERDEHTAVRTRAGLFDLSHMGEITVTGPQAASFLNHALVGNIASVGTGRARYTMICRSDGGILDDLIVYRLAETEAGSAHYMVVANASNAQVVLDALTERAAGFDVEVRDDRDAYALIAVQGPQSAGVLTSLTDADLDGLKYYAGLPGTVAGVPALIARTGYTGEDGFELFVKPEHAVELWQALTKAGEGVGLVPCGLSCRDTLRLEAGMPLYGHELSTSLTPFDAGLGRVVKFEKEGDFVGREALQEAATRSEQNPRGSSSAWSPRAAGSRAPDTPSSRTAGSSARSPPAPPPPRWASRSRWRTSTRRTRHRARPVSEWTSGAVTSRTRSWRCRSTSVRSSGRKQSACVTLRTFRCSRTFPAVPLHQHSPAYRRIQAMSNPQQLRYSKEHEWLSGAENGVSTVGITEHAANALGDVVFVQLPEVGAGVTAGETCGELESTKSVSDLYSPVNGEVTEVNEDVVNDPSLVNSAPFEGGWLFKVRVAEEPADLLSADEYTAFSAG